MVRTLARLDALVLSKEQANAAPGTSLVSLELVWVSLCGTALCQVDILVELTCAQLAHGPSEERLDNFM